MTGKDVLKRSDNGDFFYQEILCYYIYGFVVAEDKAGLERQQNSDDDAHIMVDEDNSY